MLTRLKEQFYQLPETVRLFIKRALLLFVGWKIVYDGFLQPQRIPDEWLTNLTSTATAALVSIVYAPTHTILTPLHAYIIMNGKEIIGIADGCNAFDLMVTYVAFLLCLPTSWKRVLIFTLFGVPSIFGLNIIRCCAIVWLNLHHPDWVDVAHHYVFQIMVYAFIFFLWMKYLQPFYGKK